MASCTFSLPTQWCLDLLGAYLGGGYSCWSNYAPVPKDLGPIVAASVGANPEDDEDDEEDEDDEDDKDDKDDDEEEEDDDKEDDDDEDEDDVDDDDDDDQLTNLSLCNLLYPQQL